MKLLFLTTCGLSNEPEDIRYINLYLASLKKNVVSKFDNIKVILYNNANIPNSAESLTHKRVKEFGLDSVVEVKNVYEIGLPQKAIEFLQSQSWQNKIGLNQNMLFDYAKKNNFFDADWIFHTDSDIEFLENFDVLLKKINNLTEINQEIFICLAGDSYPYAIYHNEYEFLLKDPRRLSLFDENEKMDGNYQRRTIQLNNRGQPTSEERKDKFFFRVQQQKVRNDFVGLSRQTANLTNFNWLNAVYPSNMDSIRDENNIPISHDEGILDTLWKEKNNNTNIVLEMIQDKGSLVQLQLQQGLNNIIKIQLRCNGDMIQHFGSGYFSFHRSWITESHETLKRSYTDTQEIWQTDY